MQTMKANENTIPSTHPSKEHWATQYRNAPRNSLEGWIYLAACTVKGDEFAIREIGRIAYAGGYCTWHASWIYYGRKGLCHCADCARRRNANKAGRK